MGQTLGVLHEELDGYLCIRVARADGRLQIGSEAVEGNIIIGKVISTCGIKKKPAIA